MLESCSWMFPGWQPNSRSNTSTLEMSSLFYFDLICVVCILHTCNSSAHAQSVTESLSLSQNKRLPFYLTLWDCLTCHYTHIYPIWPMNLSRYLSISRQKNPICEKKFLILVKLDRCQPEVGPSLFTFSGIVPSRKRWRYSLTQ